MNWLDIQNPTGLDLMMGGNQLADMLFFSLEDYYLTNQSNKLLLFFF